MIKLSQQSLQEAFSVEARGQLKLTVPLGILSLLKDLRSKED